MRWSLQSDVDVVEHRVQTTLARWQHWYAFTSCEL